jgi:protein O-GlcNAc transferase
MAPMPQVSIDQAFQLAAENHRAGRLADAEAIYRQILLQNPSHADALHLLGVLASQTGRSGDAIDLISRAIELNPDAAAYHCNLCEICRRAGQLDRAIAHGRSAIRLDAQSAMNHCNLGVALRENGLLDESIAAHRRAISLNPAYAFAIKSLGDSLHGNSQFHEAITAYRRSIQLARAEAETYRNLSIALKITGQIAEAIAVLRRAIQLDPNNAEAYWHFGAAMAETGQVAEAIAAFRRAIEIKPSMVEAYRSLAVVLSDNDRLDEAIDVLRRAIGLNREYAGAHSALAVAFAQTGELDQAIAAFRTAVELKPGDANLRSNLAYIVQFHPAYDAEAILEECRRWSVHHEKSVSSARTGLFPNDPSPDRRLGIGYISGNFSGHVVGRNVLPLLQNHNHGEFEIFCYSNSRLVDDLTRKFQSTADHWRQIDTADDSQTAEMIRKDGIDILVDLSLHMGHNRLPVFARKPAPVQVTFAGYPGTTGLKAMDFRMTDPFLDPPGQGDSHYSEKSIRLAHSFWCYDPVAMHPADDLPVAPLPAGVAGKVTFGCLNNFRKVNDLVLDLWSEVLRALPESRLILLAPPGNSRRRILDRLDLRRVEFVDRRDRPAYLRTYDRIDIGLDTFPYNGHTTTLDSLWMGVPVVTLIGWTVVGRAGWSQLCNLGLPELAAHTPQEFVKIALNLATDLSRLSELRKGLRQQMKRSPLTDIVSFAREVEAAYRGMWKSWCLSVVD